jgi:molecular chaperone GrpE
MAAELENERKIFRQQMEQMYKYSNKKLVSWVLDFFVDLEEKALKAMRTDPEGKIKNHLLGLEMMRNILWKNLENEGVKEMKIEVGKDRWSSRLHELVEEIENNNLPEGTITEVFEKGYLFADQVLRPAKVIISKKATKNKSDEQNQENKN